VFAPFQKQLLLLLGTHFGFSTSVRTASHGDGMSAS
jgi:hypothetical protein